MNDIFQYTFWKALQQLPFIECITLYGSRNEELADDIYARIINIYYPLLQQSLDTIQEKYT